MKPTLYFLLPFLLLLASCSQETPLVLLPLTKPLESSPSKIEARFNGYEIGNCVLQDDKGTYFLYLTEDVHIPTKTDLILAPNDILKSTFFMDLSQAEPGNKINPDTLKYSVQSDNRPLIHHIDSVVHLFVDTLNTHKKKISH